jgi:hypothetical protein
MKFAFAMAATLPALAMFLWLTENYVYISRAHVTAPGLRESYIGMSFRRTRRSDGASSTVRVGRSRCRTWPISLHSNIRILKNRSWCRITVDAQRNRYGSLIGAIALEHGLRRNADITSLPPRPVVLRPVLPLLQTMISCWHYVPKLPLHPIRYARRRRHRRHRGQRV